MSADHARASDGATVRAYTKAEAIDIARAAGAYVLEGRARVEKYLPGEDEPFEVVDSQPNLFLTAGITNLWNLAVGLGSPTVWSQANARLAVGTGTTAAAAGQTSLVTEVSRKALNGAPVVSGNSVTFAATFATGDANVNWGEVALTTGATASAGVHLNRLVQDFGTKTASAQWILSLTLSIS